MPPWKKNVLNRKSKSSLRKLNMLNVNGLSIGRVVKVYVILEIYAGSTLKVALETV